MKANFAHKSIFAFILAALVDQLHKFYVIKIVGWQGGEYVPVTPFFDYVLVWNTGISYGLFAAIPAWGLIAIMLIASAGLAYWWATSTANLVRWGLAITLGGALGNILDRVFYGAVADSFSFHAFGYNWYIFNLADVAITLGLAALVWDMFTSKGEKA